MDSQTPTHQDYRCSKCGEHKPLGEFPPSKVKNKSQWCRRCLREDARRRKGLLATEHTIVCEFCGTSREVTDSRARFCSRECKTAARAQRWKADNDAKKSDPRRCAWCGKDFGPEMRADAKFCSAACNSKAHQSVRRYRRRVPEEAKRRRTQPLVSFIEIAERDHWKCGICGKPVNKRRQWPDPLAGSLDHLIPVAHGGGHESSNLQLSHFVCNWTKKAKPANDRLRLL